MPAVLLVWVCVLPTDLPLFVSVPVVAKLPFMVVAPEIETAPVMLAPPPPAAPVDTNPPVVVVPVTFRLPVQLVVGVSKVTVGATTLARPLDVTVVVPDTVAARLPPITAVKLPVMLKSSVD